MGRGRHPLAPGTPVSEILCESCGRPVKDGLPLCFRPCTAALVADLRAVPGVVADLAVANARLDRMTSGRNGGRSVETPLPMRPDIAKRLAALNNTLSTWARVVAEHEHIAIVVSVLQQLVLDERSETYQREQADGSTVTVLRHPAELSLLPVTTAEVCALWLSTQPHALRSLPAALEAHDGLTDVIASARMAMDRRELVYAGPCGACRHDLYIDRGVDTVRCSYCSAQYDARDVSKLLLEQVSETLVTREEALGAVHSYRGRRIPETTWYRWRRSGKLMPRAWQHGDQITDHWIYQNDPPLFRLGDVLALQRITPDEPRRKIRRNTHRQPVRK